MKITRNQLRRLIAESTFGMLNENAYETMMKNMFKGKGQASTGHLKLSDANQNAAILHFKGKEFGADEDTKKIGTNNQVKNVMSSIADKTKATTLKKNDYYIWTGLDKFWSSGMTEMGEIGTKKNDPYLYQKEGSKLRVVAGPRAKSIGATFTLKQQDEEKFSFGKLFSSSMKSSGDSSMKSSDSSFNSVNPKVTAARKASNKFSS